MGVLPDGGGEPQQKYFYFAEYFSAPNTTFDLWTINGNPFNTEIGLITGNASNTLNPSGSIIAFDSKFPWTFDYISSLPSIPTGFDSFGNPQTPTWTQGGSELVCWELFVPQTDLLFATLNIGLNLVNFIESSAFFGTLLDVSNNTQIALLDTLYKSMFGLQAEVTSTLDSNGDYIIRINNTYEGYAPQWNSFTLGSLTFIQVPC